MAAAGLDSIGAIVGFAICSGIAIPSGSIVYSILSGPLQVPLLPPSQPSMMRITLRCAGISRHVSLLG